MKTNRFCRILSILLVLALSAAFLPVIHAGAEEQTAAGDAGHVIYFNANVSGWENYSLIMVYCYRPGTDEFFMDWMAKKKGGMTNEGNGIWSYDFDQKGITLDDGKQYCLIFVTDTGYQTHELLFDTTCFGDTAIPDDANVVENHVDSNKHAILAYWQSGKLGPMMCFTSTGRIVGEVIPAGQTAYGMLLAFLARIETYDGGLQTALYYSKDKTAQEIIDEAASKLMLNRDDVKKAIGELRMIHDWSKEWNYDQSSVLMRGDYDSDDEITVMDATRVQNLVAEDIVRPTEAFLKQIDADGDGELTIMDATRIQYVVAYLMNMEGEWLCGHVDGVAD